MQLHEIGDAPAEIDGRIASQHLIEDGACIGIHVVGGGRAGGAWEGDDGGASVREASLGDAFGLETVSLFVDERPGRIVEADVAARGGQPEIRMVGTHPFVGPDPGVAERGQNRQRLQAA